MCYSAPFLNTGSKPDRTLIPALSLHRCSQRSAAPPRDAVPLGQREHQLGEVRERLEFGQSEACVRRGPRGEQLGPTPLRDIWEGGSRGTHTRARQ